MKFILTCLLAICSLSVEAEPVKPAIWEYVYCRPGVNNALDPRPKAPEWMRQSNLKCRALDIFNIDTTKLTMPEFNSRWQVSGGPELLASTFAKIEKMSAERRLPREVHSNFAKHTEGSTLLELFGFQTSYDKIKNRLRQADLFSNDQATAILVMGRAERFLSNNKLLLEIMLKRHFARGGELALPRELEKVIEYSQRRQDRGELKWQSVLDSKNYYNFILAAHQLIEEGADDAIANVKASITDRNRITFMCPNLIDYISFIYGSSRVPNKNDFDATPNCRKWYKEITIEANFKLEQVKETFFAKQKKRKLQIEERIK